MPGVEDLAHPAHAETDRVHPVTIHQNLIAKPLTVPHSPRVVGQQDRASVGIDIADANQHVGVGCRGRNVELNLDGTGPFDRLPELAGGERQHVVLLLKAAGITGSREPPSGNRAGVFGIAGVTCCRTGSVGHVGLIQPQSATVLQEVRGGSSLRWEIVGFPPEIARCVGFSDRSHHVVPHGGTSGGGQFLAFQVVIKPADHRPVDIDGGVLGIHQFTDPVPLVSASVQPGSNQQLLLSDRSRAAAVLAALETGNRPLVHEVVPAADGETRNVHSSEVPRAVLGLPVLVVIGVLEPLGHQRPVVCRHAAVGVHALEPIGPCRPAQTVALLVEAQPGIDHVLAGQVRRTRDGEEILGVAALGTAKGTDLAGAPLSTGEPLAGVIPILQLSPGQGAVPDPGPLGLLGAAEIHVEHPVAIGGQLRGQQACALPLQAGITLFEDARPGSLALGEIEISGEPFAVSHRHHDTGFGDVTEVEVIGGSDRRRGQQHPHQPGECQAVHDCSHLTLSRPGPIAGSRTQQPGRVVVEDVLDLAVAEFLAPAGPFQ